MKNHHDTPTPKDLLHDLQTLVAEAETMLADTVTEHSAEAVAALRERFGAAQERFSDAYDGARRKVIASAKAADETIRANPYQSLAIAAGVGILAGFLLGRRGK
jgi:ElaB/YqjD/DUF883 family membrane-anchored ribosome-binding protein